MNIKRTQGPSRLDTHQLESTMFHHRPQPGFTLENILEPNYWHKVSRGLREGNRIECFAGDGSYWAMLLVTGWASTGVEVKALQYVELDETFAGEDPVFKVRFRNATWAVWNTHYDEPVNTSFVRKQDAAEWLASNAHALRQKMIKNDPAAAEIWDR